MQDESRSKVDDGENKPRSIVNPGGDNWGVWGDDVP